MARIIEATYSNANDEKAGLRKQTLTFVDVALVLNEIHLKG
jgi:hypothetical protein